MSQEEVKSSCSGTPQGLREALKLLKGVLVLLSKEDIDGFSFRAKSLIHMVLMYLSCFYLVPGELEVRVFNIQHQVRILLVLESEVILEVVVGVMLVDPGFRNETFILC